MNLFPAIHSFAPRVVNFKEFFYLKERCPLIHVYMTLGVFCMKMCLVLRVFV